MIHAESVKQWEAETESYRNLIGELRAEIERLCAHKDALGAALQGGMTERDQLRAGVERLRAALEWYAQGGTNWDAGKRARIALADQGKGGG